MNAPTAIPPVVRTPLVKLRLAALVALTLLAALPPRRRHRPTRRRHLRRAQRLPDGRRPGGDRRHHFVQSRRKHGCAAIDVTATITDVRATCQDRATTWSRPRPSRRRPAPRCRPRAAGRAALFRRRAAGRQPVVAKRVGQVVLNSRPATSTRWTRVQATVRVNRAAATLPANVRGNPDPSAQGRRAEAAVDPLADPGGPRRGASATFEHLVGFQMTQDQLKYNATR